MAGRERTYFAIGSATGNALSPSNLPEMYESSGRVMQSWNLIEMQLRRGGMAPALRASVVAMQKSYFEQYMPCGRPCMRPVERHIRLISKPSFCDRLRRWIVQPRLWLLLVPPISSLPST